MDCVLSLEYRELPSALQSVYENGWLKIKIGLDPELTRIRRKKLDEGIKRNAKGIYPSAFFLGCFTNYWI